MVEITLWQKSRRSGKQNTPHSLGKMKCPKEQIPQDHLRLRRNRNAEAPSLHKEDLGEVYIAISIENNWPLKVGEGYKAPLSHTT